MTVNAAGVAGPKSPSIVVNTMLETPQAPTATPLSASGNSTAAIGSRQISLVWKVPIDSTRPLVALHLSRISNRLVIHSVAREVKLYRRR